MRIIRMLLEQIDWYVFCISTSTITLVQPTSRNAMITLPGHKLMLPEEKCNVWAKFPLHFRLATFVTMLSYPVTLSTFMSAVRSGVELMHFANVRAALYQQTDRQGWRLWPMSA